MNGRGVLLMQNAFFKWLKVGERKENEWMNDWTNGSLWARILFMNVVTALFVLVSWIVVKCIECIDSLVDYVYGTSLSFPAHSFSFFFVFLSRGRRARMEATYSLAELVLLALLLWFSPQCLVGWLYGERRTFVPSCIAFGMDMYISLRLSLKLLLFRLFYGLYCLLL